MTEGLIIQPETLGIVSSALAKSLALSELDITAVLQSDDMSTGLANFMNCLSSLCSVIVPDHGTGPCSRSPAVVQQAKVVAETGLLHAFAAFCKAIASALQQSASKQKPLAKAAARLLSAAFKLWTGLACWWPGKLLVGSRGLAVTVLPVAQLIAAIFRSTATLYSPACTTNAAASSSTKAGAAVGDTALRPAWFTAANLTRLCYKEAFSSGSDHVSAAARDVLTSTAVQDAAHIAFAAAVTELTCLPADSSDPNFQQQQQHLRSELEAYHKELWTDLGCPDAAPALLAAVEKPDAEVKELLLEAPNTLLTTMQLMKIVQAEAAVEDQAEEMTPEQAGLPQCHLQRQQPKVSVSRAQALFKVSLELLLLLPCAYEPKQTQLCRHATIMLLGDLPALMPEREFGVLIGSLLGPAFKLALKVQQAVESIADEPNAVQIEKSTGGCMSRMLERCSALEIRTMSQSDVEALVTAVSADPNKILCCLQTLLRFRGLLLQPATPRDRLRVLTAACKITAVSSPPIRAVAAQAAAATAGTGAPVGAGQQPQGLQETLLSVLLTCLKLANICIPDCGVCTLCFRLAVFV